MISKRKNFQHGGIGNIKIHSMIWKKNTINLNKKFVVVLWGKIQQEESKCAELKIALQ